MYEVHCPRCHFLSRVLFELGVCPECKWREGDWIAR